MFPALKSFFSITPTARFSKSVCTVSTRFLWVTSIRLLAFNSYCRSDGEFQYFFCIFSSSSALSISELLGGSCSKGSNRTRSHPLALRFRNSLWVHSTICKTAVMFRLLLVFAREREKGLSICFVWQWTFCYNLSPSPVVVPCKWLSSYFLTCFVKLGQSTRSRYWSLITSVSRLLSWNSP